MGNIGRDPFGEPVRAALTPVEIVHQLAEVGTYGVNFHDNILVPIDATPAECGRIVRDFKAALDATGIVVPMATTNLFYDSAIHDGAFTANDPAVRAYALQKTMRAIDLGVELGAKQVKSLGWQTCVAPRFGELGSAQARVNQSRSVRISSVG